jgi:hypothetical protein
LNQQAQDLMMSAPSEVLKERLKELHIEIKLPTLKVKTAAEGETAKAS